MSTSTPDKPVKLNIGFHGGQVLAIRVKPEELVKLRGLLGSGGGWHELSAETGTVVLDVTRVDYILVDDEAQRIGF